MKFPVRQLFVCAAFISGFMLTFSAFAQEAPPASPPPPAQALPPAAEEEKKPPTPAAAPTEEAAPNSAPETDPEKSSLRRIDADPADPAADNVTEKSKAVRKRQGVRRSGPNNNDRVAFSSDVEVSAAEKVLGDAVAIFGRVKIDGEVQSDAVAVFGGVTVDGLVHGDVVAVMGDVTLGPKAHVDGDVVVIGGQLHRDPAAFVGGEATKVDVGRNISVGAPLQAWWTQALKVGRPLAFGAGLAWLWIAAAFTLGFYALLALVFPEGIRKTGDTLVQRPAAVILSALFTLLAVPLLFVLLLVTIIGIPVALIVLPVAVALGVLFGKAAIYGLIGRKLTGERLHLSLAVLVGASIFVLFALVPLVGLLVALLTGALGLGCTVTALFTSSRRKSAPQSGRAVPVSESSFVAPTAPYAPGMVSPAPLLTDSLSARPSASFTPEAMEPPPVFTARPAAPLLNALLPRAGFWIRTGALLIDLVLVAIICGPIGAGELILPGLAAYGAAMWKVKGSTIGGIVCGLRVVRLDERAIDWPTAIVRALGCFLSLAVAGLGFVWVVFDDERQSWHDKIAGTVVVRAPKGTSLV